MKNISLILFLIFISSLALYSQKNHMGGSMHGGRRGSTGCTKCNNLLMQFEKNGINFTDEQRVVIMAQYKKTDAIQEGYLIEKRKIEKKIAAELVKTNPNKNTVKALILDKNIVEAEIEYVLVEFDLYLLSFLSKEEIFLLNQEHHRSRRKQN